MREGTEVITTVDKQQRDSLFEDLRKNGNEQERQVVKFSGVESVLGEAGIQEGRFVFYDKRQRKPQWRPLYRSNWSVAYPKS